MYCWLCENQGACEVHDAELWEKQVDGDSFTLGKAVKFIDSETRIVILDEDGHGLEVVDMTYLMNEDVIQLKVRRP
jgi:hypothetical protein